MKRQEAEKPKPLRAGTEPTVPRATDPSPRRAQRCGKVSFPPRKRLCAHLTKSPLKTKKYRMIFYDKSHSKRLGHQDFGAKGYNDFTLYNSNGKTKEAREAKANYLKRHSVNENWNDPFSAGALSRFILWNKPSILGSFEDYLKRFGFSKCQL